jgi:DNA-binding response OmpR family regulator
MRKDVSILVVDDAEGIRNYLQNLLSLKGFQARTANGGEQALQMIASGFKPSVIILDVMMPEMDGLTVCKEIRKTSNAPVIILTARDDDVDKIVGLEIGADDYMTKPFNPRELVARVKAVLRRSQGSMTPEQVLEVGDIRLDPLRREVTVGGRTITLRAKEFDLLSAFMRYQGLVLDRERLLSLVWGQDFYGDTRTIDVHVAWLREKLTGAKARVQTVWGVGYKLVLDEEAAPAKS